MIILDTNILSELMLVPQRKTIVDWLDLLPEEDVFTTSITLMEVDYGIEILP